MINHVTPSPQSHNDVPGQMPRLPSDQQIYSPGRMSSLLSSARYPPKLQAEPACGF